MHSTFGGSPLLASIASNVVASAPVNDYDALPLKKLPPVAKKQYIAVASVTKAVKVRGEDDCINPNLVRREDELAMYFTYGLAASPRHFSMIAVCGNETYFPLSRLVTRLPSATIYSNVHTWWWSPSIYSVVWQHQATYVHICAQNKQYTKKRHGCDRLVFDGHEWRSQRKRCRSLSPCRVIQRSSYR